MDIWAYQWKSSHTMTPNDGYSRSPRIMYFGWVVCILFKIDKYFTKWMNCIISWQWWSLPKIKSQLMWLCCNFVHFQGIDQLVEATEENQPGTFHGDFHMEFCDNKKQLFQAYFRDFTIDRLEYPWQAFTGGWYVYLNPFRSFHTKSLILTLRYWIEILLGNQK